MMVLCHFFWKNGWIKVAMTTLLQRYRLWLYHLDLTLFKYVCIFLTIDFCENLHEYFFVWNQFLFIKTIRKNAKIFYKVIILALLQRYRPWLYHVDLTLFKYVCIFLTIDFCENWHKYFFVWNLFLFIKTIRKNAKIFYKAIILAFFYILFV